MSLKAGGRFLRGEIPEFASCRQLPVMSYTNTRGSAYLFHGCHRIGHDVGHHEESLVDGVHLGKGASVKQRTNFPTPCCYHHADGCGNHRDGADESSASF